METLRVVMVNLLVLVFLTTLLDLLLPDGTMRSYIKMTMGFFVVLTLLQPVMQLADPQGMAQQWQLTVPSVTAVADSVQAQSAVYEQQQQALEDLYREKMEEQVKALLLLTSEVESLQVDCVVEEQTLQQIRVWIRTEDAMDTSRMQQALCGYYGLPAEQVQISTEEGTADGVEQSE